MSQAALPNRRRDKPVLSCTFCRTRKIGCDRRSPCSACIRRGKPAECVYNTPAQERKNAIDYRPRARGQQTRQRIARLENLVTELRDKSTNPETKVDIKHSIDSPVPTPSPQTKAPEKSGSLSTTDEHAVYTGSSHWATILEDIQGLKDEMVESYPESTTSRESTPNHLDSDSPSHNLRRTRISLLTSAGSLSKEQVVAMMPPRKVCFVTTRCLFSSDEELLAYITDPVILHKRKFLAEYTSFWSNPFAAPIMWVGLLFSVISMSANLQSKDAEAFGAAAGESENMLETCRALTIHCLNSGNYLQPQKYTIETLLLHFAVEQNVNVDTYIGNWVLIGVIVRIALRMGLHRDPSHWPSIRPLQAELRRRIWLALYQMDYFTSTQVGLPRIIKDSQCDARPPAHLLDDDITFEHGELPPERSLEDNTALSFIIHRHSIIKVAAEIYDSTEAGPPSSSTIAALTSKLEHAISVIPQRLKPQSFESSIADDPVIIMNRMFLDILVQKAIYTLHRQNFLKDKSNDHYTSQAKCIDAALIILDYLQKITEETEPGGLMFNIRWKLVSSLTHEFLQATMMLCFALSREKEATESTGGIELLHRRSDILEALAFAKGLWERNSERSTEAMRAVKVISTVLGQGLNTNAHAASMEASDIFFNIPGDAENNGGTFDYENGMALDPFLFAGGPDFSDAGHLFDEFVTF